MDLRRNRTKFFRILGRSSCSINDSGGRGPFACSEQTAGEERERELLSRSGADLCAHEDDVGNAETDCDQGEDSCQMRPDENQALLERERRGQDAFGLALQSETENPRGWIEQHRDA